MSVKGKYAVVVAIVVMFVLLQSLSIIGQEDQSAISPEEQERMMQEYMKLMQPSEHHSYLDPMVGEWDITTTVWMSGPGSDPSTSTGSASFEWVLGGRYLMGKVNSEMMGVPYNGISLLGYDNYRNMYVWVLAHSLSTQIEYVKGSTDPEHKHFRFFGEMDEPTIDVVGRTIEYALTIEDSNQMRLDVIDLHAGDSYKVVEVKYTRSESE